MITEERYGQYIKILREELVPAMGCTEPIAIAYAASIISHALGGAPSKMRVGLSGNIIKNVKDTRNQNQMKAEMEINNQDRSNILNSL